MKARTAACVDVGSTYTKAAIVDVDSGALLATASHPTTSDTDVLHGLDKAIAATGHTPDETYVCSSAGGGLRLAVVGYEALVSAEAGRRVALSAGARVVHVAAGRLDGAGVAALRAARPDVVLLVGGTDGGDADTLLHNAARLGTVRWRRPVVLAGNADARADAVAALRAVPHVSCDNVLPRVGDLRPGPARTAIRDVFLRHVIGGKGLSRGRRFAALVRAATPDAVLTGVELLAATRPGSGLLVVDVGGATTDVYSVLPDTGSAGAEVAGTAWHGRTVEGDLGVRWSAGGVIEAARAERMPVRDGLEQAAAAHSADPGRPADPGTDLPLAALAATVAVRRHARGEPVADGVRRGGRDLRDVSLVIGSGGVLRHAPAADARTVLAAVTGDLAGGWSVPRAPVLAIDTAYVLAPAGLLAADHPDAAVALLRAHLLPAPPGPG
ncbi:glutamate mutase L [Virgisporangium aurantiacum]|uniref:glutamate mutase L n=1 Tax=Virgisporangium aurantiacum TaxID=175570 RepID=UPI001950136A|nr:glutamate mutase L [Virgisporangium aurantiacum]